MSTTYNRREFIRRMAGVGAGAAVGLGTLGESCPREEAAPARPNILFVLTDDLRWDALSCLGHPFVRTPNLDRLAAEGVRFANAFVTLSLCSPSRACYLTGTYAHTHGVTVNDRNDPDPAQPTFPQLLQGAGYETAYVGKWHCAPRQDPRPGFDYWLSFRGQGKYVNPDLNENGRDFQAEGYMTDLLTDYAVNWLRQRWEGVALPTPRPFCLYLAHKAVHGPFTPAERHQDRFAGVEIAKPESFDDTFAGKPEWLRAGIVRGEQRDQWMANRDKSIPAEIPPGKWDPRAKGRLDYYRTLLAVDESVGRVLKTLEELGQLDSTVVVFASDNGFFHGEHRRGDKRLMYEESIRIPLLLRYPPLARPGRVVEPMALNVDLAPTFLDLAGVPIPDAMQGRSLRPLLTEENPDWRTSFLYEYFQEGWLPGVPTMLGVRTERWKYVTYPAIDDLDELYDLEADPHELRNLAEDPAHRETLQTMQQELERLRQETGYSERRPQRVDRPAQLVLHYSFDEDTPEQVRDASGRGHHGTLHGTQTVAGRTGQARRFRGKDWIEVPKSARLDPTEKPWSVEAWIQREAEDGVILAHGGQSHGYTLFLQGGRLACGVRIAGGLALCVGNRPVPPEWTHVAAVLDGSRKITLYLNGEPAGTAEAGGFIATDPHESMQIGADTGTTVGDYKAPFGFVGLIDEVKVYDGELSAEQVRKGYRP
jgi:N-acetylglucosamine-6-sulfatase